MSTTVNKYMIYCNTEAAWVYTWNTVEPTVCPNNNTHSINPTLTSIVESVSNSDTEITNFPTTVFGELSNAELTPILQLYFTYNNNPQDLRFSTSGTATITNSDSMAIVSTGASVSSSVSMVSIKPIKYHSGQGILTRFTSVFTSGVAGSEQLVGLYDTENGMGFGYNGSDFGVFHRKNSVTTWILQSNWNLDTFDGTGNSGANVNFGDEYGNVFEIQFQYLGFGAITYSIENPNTGKFIPVHKIYYSNTEATPSFSNPSFPLCIEAINTTNNTDIIVKTASMMAANQGKLLYLGPQFTSVWDNITVAKDTETMIASFQVKSTFQGKNNRSIVYATNVSFATNHADKAQILRLRKGATFTTPVWTDINTDQSTVQRLTSGTWDTGTGEILYQQNVAGGGIPTNIHIEPSPTSLYGVAGDNIVITLEGLGRGSNWGSLSWLEDQ